MAGTLPSDAAASVRGVTVAAAVNAVLRFVVEIAALVALAEAGSHVNVLLAVFLPAVAAVIWGIWAAPRSSRRRHGLGYVAIELLVIGGAVVALLLAGHATAASLLAAVALINAVLLRLLPPVG
jgi:hypothetical protein